LDNKALVLGAPQRRMTVEEAMALGNEGLEKAMAEGRQVDYLGLIGFAYNQAQRSLDMVTDTNERNKGLIEMNHRLVDRINQLEETIVDWEQEATEEKEFSLGESLSSLVGTEGAPKLAILSVIRYLNETRAS
jgi:hypothetical protein